MENKSEVNTDIRLDTQEVTDSSSVKPTTNSLIPESRPIKSDDSTNPDPLQNGENHPDSASSVPAGKWPPAPGEFITIREARR